MEILDGRTFTQKLRVGDNAKRDIWPDQIFAHNPCDDVTAAHRHRTFVDDDGIVIEFFGNATRGALNIAHVCSALARTGGSIDGNKNKIAVIQTLFIARGKIQAPGMDVAFHQLFQTRFIDG